MKFFEQVGVAILVLFTILFTILSDITYCLQNIFLSEWHNRISTRKQTLLSIEIRKYGKIKKLDQINSIMASDRCELTSLYD